MSTEIATPAKAYRVPPTRFDIGGVFVSECQNCGHQVVKVGKGDWFHVATDSESCGVSNGE